MRNIRFLGVWWHYFAVNSRISEEIFSEKSSTLRWNVENYKEELNEYWTIAVNRNLSNCEKARKKGFRGFNGIRTRGLCVSAAVLYQPELWRPIHWRPANLLSSSTREMNETQNEIMWTAGIQMKWVCDHRSECSFQFRNLRSRVT